MRSSPPTSTSSSSAPSASRWRACARAPVDPNRDSRAYDPDAYVRADDVARVLADEHGWQVEVHERRPRPAGAASAHPVHDIVLRACRTGSPSRPSGAAGPRR